MTFNVAPVMPPLQQQLWDKTLNIPLAGGFVNFFQDSNRTIPKVVYELTGTGPGSYTYVSLGSILVLSGIGTYVDAEGGNIPVYLWPFLGTPNDAIPSQTAQNYYLTVYSSTGVFQFDIPNWPGVTSGTAPSSNSFEITDNIISNGQFVDVTFSTAATSSSPVVFNTSGTNTATEIAPDWSIVTTGSGNFSVWQQTIIDDTAPGNPVTALGITSSGYGHPIILRQRILAPRILAQSYVSGTFIAETSGSSYTIVMNYTPSITGTIQQICTGNTFTSGFTLIANPSPILIADPGSGTGYVDITIVIPQNITIQISCVQLCGTNLSQIVEYLQETPEREVDHLFHYFQRAINYKPIPSYLVGWDFPLNPSQANGFTVETTANASSYTWDQTILFQSTVSKLSTSQASDGSMVINTSDVTGATQAAIIQYLTSPQIKALLENDLSVNVNAFSIPVGVIGTVSLWYTLNASLPAIGSGLSLVTTLDANGHPSTVVSGWNEIVFATNGGKAQFNFKLNNLPFPPFGTDVPLSFWPTQNGTIVPYQATFFAIVVGTSAIPYNSGNGNISFNSVSLVPGKIPTRPAPQSPDQVLNQCKYYYQKSFLQGTVPAPTVGLGTGESFSYQVGSSNTASQFGPVIRYAIPMRKTPALTYYNPLGGNGQITDTITGTDWSACTSVFNTANGFTSIGHTPNPSASTDGAALHWTSDARLGVI